MVVVGECTGGEGGERSGGVSVSVDVQPVGGEARESEHVRVGVIRAEVLYPV